MKKLILLYFLVQMVLIPLMPAFALTTIGQGDIPFTMSTPGETYIITEDLTSVSGKAITVSADNVTLNFDGFTLTYSTGGSGDGVGFAATRTNFEMYGGTIVQGGAFLGSCFDNFDAGVEGLSIHNMTLTIGLLNSSVIEIVNLTTASPNIEIYENIISLNQPTQSTGTRHGITISGSGSVTGSIHNNVITIGNHIFEARCAGIAMLGGGVGIVDIHHNTVHMNHEHQGEGISHYAAQNNTLRYNTINMNCSDCRGFLVDGNSDDIIIEDNTINFNLTAGTGAAVRARYDSDRTIIRYNTINTGGSNEEYGISFGEYCNSIPACEALGFPNDTVVHHNKVSSTFAAIRPREGLDNADIYCNEFTASAAGYPVEIQSWDATNEEMSNVDFSFNELIGGAGSLYVNIDVLNGSPLDPANFCSSNPVLSSSNFNNGVENTDYEITTSSCPDGSANCYDSAGVRSEASTSGGSTAGGAYTLR